MTMASEPDFLSQTVLALGSREQIDWMTARANEAAAKGARWHRWSVDPSHPGLILHEAWHVRPTDTDGNLEEGKPRFQLTAAD
jgi:hypothetical protein